VKTPVAFFAVFGIAIVLMILITLFHPSMRPREPHCPKGTTYVPDLAFCLQGAAEPTLE